MKKTIFTAAVIAALPATLCAQSAIDAYKLSQTELSGTARFMSMAGAFGALGGDLSTLSQNPAGVGVYRSSEVGVTLDIDIQKSAFQSLSGKITDKQTKVGVDNFGYVGSTNLYSDFMPTFSWGVSYRRAMSFDRIYSTYNGNLDTSLSNYAAWFTTSQGWGYDQITPGDDYDPYINSNAPWLSSLAACSHLISPVGNSESTYDGLFQYDAQDRPYSSGESAAMVRERGYVDEYNIDFGGNFANVVYWGLGFGITDLSFQTTTAYQEEILNARIPKASDAGPGTQDGYANYTITNWHNVSGNGFNFKFGLIVKPINELRIGFAIHTPTYYSLTHNVNAQVDYLYQGIDAQGEYTYDSESDGNKYNYTDWGSYSSKLHSPWRMIVSAAGVIGGRAIISADYEYEAYTNMSIGDEWGRFEDVTNDIKDYYKSTNTLRLGMEYRLTPHFSVRAGYSYKSSPSQNDFYNNQKYVATSGTNTMYTFDNSTQYVTCGIGYRYKNFYADAAYVNRQQKARWSAFTPFDISEVPSGELKFTNNHIVMSIGLKF